MMHNSAVKIGSLIPVWWDTQSDPPNMARVIEVLPYTGRYKDMFDVVLRLSDPGTKRGWLEMAYNTQRPTLLEKP